MKNNKNIPRIRLYYATGEKKDILLNKNNFYWFKYAMRLNKLRPIKLQLIMYSTDMSKYIKELKLLIFNYIKHICSNMHWKSNTKTCRYLNRLNKLFNKKVNINEESN